MSRLPVTNNGSLVSIAGVNVPRGASSLQISYMDLSDKDSGNSTNGTMWKGYIGSKRKLNIVWNSLYPEHMRTVLQAVQGKNEFNVQFYDWESGAYVTSAFYVGDRNVDVKVFYNNHELAGLSMNLIEVRPYNVPTNGNS